MNREKTGLSGHLAHVNGSNGKGLRVESRQGSWAVSLLCVGLAFRLALCQCSLIAPLDTRIYQGE